MKLIWHIILKDIVRDRVALLTWALFFVGQDLIGVFARHSTRMDDEWVIGLQVASAVLVFLEVTMGYVLVARLVQADALVGTSIFWRTRPISAGRLLAAKLLGALLPFALLPVLLLLPWWLYCQFGWREILWSAVNVVGWQLLMLAPAFLVASLTDDLGRVLLWTLLLVIGLTSWIILLQSSLVGPLSRLTTQVGVSVMHTRLWACSLVMIVGSLAIAAHQFLTRRFARSVGLVVIGLGLVALTGQVWVWNWTPAFAALHKPALEPVDPALVGRLAFAVEPARGRFGGGFKEKDPNKKDASLDLRLRVSGLPEDLGITAEDFMSHTWSWGDGRKLTRNSGYFWSNNSPGNAVLRRAYSLPVWEEDPETIRWRKVRWDRRIADMVARGAQVLPWRGRYPPAPEFEMEGTQLRGYVNLPNSYLAKMKTEPPAYRADARWMLYRPEVVAELPLKDGVRATGPGQTLHLRQMNGHNPLVISTHPAVNHNGVWFAVAATSEFRNWFYRERFAAVNRVNGDITGVRDGQKGSRSLQVGGVIVTWNVLQVTPRMMIREDKEVVADPQWLDHTVLVLLMDKNVARFDRAVDTAKFELEPEATDKAPNSAEP